MYHFFKKIWALKSDKQKVVLPEDDQHKNGEIFFFNRIDLLKVLIPYTLIVIALFSLLFTFTPIGNLVPSPEDKEVRSQIIEIHQRLISLRDTIQARDLQLEAFKTALRQSRDTTFTVQLSRRDALEFSETETLTPLGSDFSPSEMLLRPEDIILSTQIDFKFLPEFPREFPVIGTLTRRFSTTTGHAGVDIATIDGEFARSVANGTVIFAGFTVRYGNVVIIKHNNEYLSIYKHCKSLTVEKGTFVQAGQIIGQIGKYGTLTTGPHLHFELWKNMVPVDPVLYFPNLVPES